MNDGYDGIGNLLFSAVGTVTNTYAANALNQYTNMLCAPASLRLDYDPDGNMLTNGVWAYTWDAENRLNSVEADGVPLVSNAYDYLGRRFRKTSGSVTRTYVYDGWNLCRETETSGGVAVTNIYVWGLDLSGTVQGAGGVGGLLADTTCNKQPVTCNTYFPCYDANGNVTDYVDASGNLRARYTYSAFGETTSQAGDIAGAFTHRFSTKPFDAETGVSKYQLRDYLPGLGRWASRDPIGEVRSSLPNFYNMVKNNPVDFYDVMGLFGDGIRKLGPHVSVTEYSGNYTAKGEPLTWQVQVPVPWGHSDFTGGEYFDYTLEDNDFFTDPTGVFWLFSAGRHFRPRARSYDEAHKAVCLCQKDNFQRAMHRLQDNYSHFVKDYKWSPFTTWKNLGFGHAAAALFGDEPDNDRVAWDKAEKDTVPLVELWDTHCGRGWK